jgi:hypothetical protein
MKRPILAIAIVCVLLIPAAVAITAEPKEAPPDPAAQELAKEMAGLGWIVFSAKSGHREYDLVRCRPDGSHLQTVSHTPGFSSYGGRFSHDGKKLLYRRLASGKGINHDLWGMFGELVTANADGSNPVVQGKEDEYPWACWSPDDKQISCLYKKERLIRIFDLATKQLVKEMPAGEVYQQLYWSADGKRLCGTANVTGRSWNIVSIELDSGKVTVLTRNLNCTGDWFQHDPLCVIYSNRTPGIGGSYGMTMLMQANADGKRRKLIYGELGRHIYYGCTSPDDKYAVFSRPRDDGGLDGPMAIVRLADTPIVVPETYSDLTELYPNAKHGPVLYLAQPGFEPHWTYAEIEEK